MKDNTLKLEIRPYMPKDLKQLIEVYKSAFAESPWDEFMKCVKCKTNYGRNEVEISKELLSEEIMQISFEPLKKTKVGCSFCKTTKEKAFCKKCGEDLTADMRYLNSDVNQLPIDSLEFDIGFQNLSSPNFVPYWSNEEIMMDLNNAFCQDKTIALVADNSQKLAGFTWGYKLPFGEFSFLKGKISENSNYMDEIAVGGNMRNKGIGLQLGESYLRQAFEQGLDQVVLRTNINNTSSMSLFKKLGFESTNIFDPKYSDRIYLARSLDKG